MLMVLQGPLLRLDEVESTQDEARRRLEMMLLKPYPGRKREMAHVLTLTARYQSKGRGRHGRRWLAPRDTAALVSIGFILPERSAGMRLGMQVALAAAGCIERLIQQAVAIKWPNDVLINGGKVAGVLVETTPLAGVMAAIAGIGINVLAAPLGTATCLAAYRPGVSIEEVVLCLLAELDGLLLRDNPVREKSDFARLLSPLPADCGDNLQVKGASAGYLIASGSNSVCQLPLETIAQ